MCTFMVFKQLKVMSTFVMVFLLCICHTPSFLTDLMNKIDARFFVSIQHGAFFFSFILFPSVIS